MSIHYKLVGYKLNGKSDAYKAVVKPCGTIRWEDIVERIANRGSTVGRADILAVFEDLCAIVEYLLLQGWNVATPLAHFRSSIKGTFEQYDDCFDRRRHEIVPRVIPGERLRKAFKRKARASRRSGVIPEPHPIAYTDVNSGARNSALTPQGAGLLSGCRLCFDPADPAQGIFFVALGEGLPIPGGGTRVQLVVRNEPKELLFVVPDLAPGDYRLEVRATPRNCAQVRHGRLNKTLTVAGLEEDSTDLASPDTFSTTPLLEDAGLSSRTGCRPGEPEPMTLAPEFDESLPMIRRIPAHDSTSPDLRFDES